MARASLNRGLSISINIARYCRPSYYTENASGVYSQCQSSRLGPIQGMSGLTCARSMSSNRHPLSAGTKRSILLTYRIKINLSEKQHKRHKLKGRKAVAGPVRGKEIHRDEQLEATVNAFPNRCWLTGKLHPVHCEASGPSSGTALWARRSPGYK